MEAERLDQHVQPRELAARIALAQAAERRRIAIGLHDEVGQLLATAKLRLDACLAAPGDAPSEPLVAIGGLLDQAIWATRALTFELGSPVLCVLGLEEALRSLGEQIEQTHGLRVRVDADAEPAPLTDDLRDLLFRVARELLLNVVRHGGAGQVDLRVERVGTDLRLTVCDDGVGFDASAAVTGVSAGGGIGLFDARPGAGSRVVAIAPLPSPTDGAPEPAGGGP